MLAHFIYSTLLAFGLIKFIPFGLSTPAVVQSNAPSSAGQVAAPASEGFGSSSSPELALAGLRQARDDPSGAYGEFGGGGEFSVVTGCTVSGTAALTFDDGPWIYTNDIVAMLKAANATATFFYNGRSFGCIYNPDSVERVQLVYNSGHQIASHTWSHPDLATLSWDQINDEMWRIDDALSKILGVTPAFIRPPYGSYNDDVLRAAAFRRQTVVTWDFDSQDSAGASPDVSRDLYSQLVERHPDTILALNHETSDITDHQVIPFAIQKLQSAGYRLVSVADCLGQAPYLNIQPPRKRDASWAC